MVWRVAGLEDFVVEEKERLVPSRGPEVLNIKC